MKSAMFGPIITVTVALALTGCSLPSPWGPGGTWFNPSEQVQGPDPVVKSAAIENADLIKEIVPLDKLNDYTAGSKTFPPDSDDQKLALAYHLFYEKYVDQRDNREKAKIYRNRVQDRLLQASKQRCGEYIKFVRQFESEGNFVLGTLTTILGGAGAIVTGVDASRALSAAAAIMSGTRAEFQQAFFSNLATHVIIPGIESKLEDIHDKIFKKRADSIADYTIEDAIGDALGYHAHCNLITGIIHAGETIHLAKNPGLDTLNESLNKVVTVRDTAARLTTLSTGNVAGALDQQQTLFVDIEEAAGALKELKAKLGVLQKKTAELLANNNFKSWHGEIRKIQTALAKQPTPVEKVEKAQQTALAAASKHAAELKSLAEKLERTKKSDQRDILKASISEVRAKIVAVKNELADTVQESLSTIENVEETLSGYETLKGRIDKAKQLVNALAHDTNLEDINALAKALNLSSTGAQAKTDLLNLVDEVKTKEKMDRVAELIKKFLKKDV